MRSASLPACTVPLQLVCRASPTPPCSLSSCYSCPWLIPDKIDINPCISQCVPAAGAWLHLRHPRLGSLLTGRRLPGVRAFNA